MTVIVSPAFWMSLSDGAPGILLICPWVPYFTKTKAPTITGAVLVFKCQISFFYFYIHVFSQTFEGLFLRLGTLMLISLQTFSCLSLIIMSERFAWSVLVEKSQMIVTSVPSTTRWQIFQCRYWLTLSWLFLYSLSISIQYPDIRWSIVSIYWSQKLHFGSVLLYKIITW